MSFFNKVKSVESILGSLTSTVAELESHAEDQLAKAGFQQEAAELAKVAEVAHRTEHELATKVANNIKALLGA